MTSQKACSAASQESFSDANFVFLTGTVESPVECGTTGQGAKCASFLLRVRNRREQVFRINAYERTAEHAQIFTEGDHAQVHGELITRLSRGGAQVTEVKAHAVSRLTA